MIRNLGTGMLRSVCEHTPPPAKRFAQILPLDFVSRGLFSIKISRNLKCSEGSVVESRFQKSWSRPSEYEFIVFTLGLRIHV